VVHFAKWRPFNQNALSPPILAPARDRPDPGMEGSEEALAHETATSEAISEAAE
jgi:hypothetical protein